VEEDWGWSLLAGAVTKRSRAAGSLNGITTTLEDFWLNLQCMLAVKKASAAFST
jgi:hypothetical protein